MCEEGCRKSILVEHLHGSTEPACRVKLMKMSKAWQWEISCSGEDFPTVIRKIDEANEILKQRYEAPV